MKTTFVLALPVLCALLNPSSPAAAQTQVKQHLIEDATSAAPTTTCKVTYSSAKRFRQLSGTNSASVIKNDDAIASDFYDPPTSWNPGPKAAAFDPAKWRVNKDKHHLNL